MFPPCELMMKGFLPALRGLISHTLRERGLSQSKIAALIGVSQAAVSQILSKNRAQYLEKILEMGFERGEVETLLNLLLEDIVIDPVKATQTLYYFWRNALERGTLCSYHRRLYPQLALCKVCLRRWGLGFDEDSALTLRKVGEAVKLLESSPHIAHLVPEVSMNVAQALKNAKTLEDVAAVPGRIVKVRDRVRAVSGPEFGGSRHLAEILINIMKFSPKIRAVLNLKLDEKILETVESLGFRYAVTGHPTSHRSVDEVVKAVAQEFEEKGELDVVMDWGGIGLEPTTYVFGSDAVEAARKALLIASTYVTQT